MSNPNRKRWRTLTRELEELEATNPEVARAAENYDRAVESILYWGRINDRRAAEGKRPIGPYVKREPRGTSHSAFGGSSVDPGVGGSDAGDPLLAGSEVDSA